MCQLSLPAEYSIGPQILAPTKLKKTKAVTFKPNPKGLHKMQYTSVIILGFLNAFALAVPINQIRSPIPPEAEAAVANGIAAGEAGIDSGIAAADAAIAEYGKRSPIPPEAAAAVTSADGEIESGLAQGEAGLNSGIAAGNAAIAEYAPHQKRTDR